MLKWSWKVIHNKSRQTYSLWTFNVYNMYIWCYRKYGVCRGKDCMKKFCESLREHLLKIINFEKKKMIPLTHEEYESYLNQIKCPICKKKYWKVKIYCHLAGKCRSAAHSICNLKYSIPKEIPLVWFFTMTIILS